MSPVLQDEEVGGGGGFEEVNREEHDRRIESKELEDSVAAHPEDASLRFQLGLSLWENSRDSSESKERAAEHFVVSAKYNPGHGPTFKYLGHYYCRVSLEFQRALKCYRRALAIDPDDSESGEALCDMLDRSGNDTLELAVCNEACERSPRAFWAFRRLGYLHLYQKRWSEAVQCLQQAIRGYPASADLWEALGLAYQRLGMFTAATKSYGRAIELEDTRIFALVESGNVFLMLGSFRKGIELFHQALQISPENISANYGLASGLLGLSKECMNLGALRWGASLLEDACKIAAASAQMAGNISCLWKLHGDIQLTYARCFPWMEEDKLIQSDATFNRSLVSWKQTCLSAAFSSRRSYLRALHLAPWQASAYADTALVSGLISSMDDDSVHDLYSWQLQEKMVLGALLLEGYNYEFWVTLGCLSGHAALKQHALIRGLQLDLSLASAWAYLGKIYREEGEKKLARQAFDCSRSIDPSLALPWAGMSADSVKGLKSDEEFESCLRAVHILPLAGFQIGLCYLALFTGNLASSQVYAAIKQAVQRAPQSAEAHNLNGLACEARFEYESAVASYRISRCVIHNCWKSSKSHYRDITINIARSLVKAGCALDAVHECENLSNEGMLDTEGMQIYAYALWQHGDTNRALGVASTLAATVSTVGKTSASAIVGFISRLLYCISGIDPAITYMLKMPKEAFASTKVSLVVRAIRALDQSTRLQSTVSNRCYGLLSDVEAVEMNYLMALSELVKLGPGHQLAYGCGVTQLRSALHLYPSSNLIRNLLGHLLLSKEWKDTHLVSRCCIIRAPFGTSKDGLRSGYEILGSATVSCYSSGSEGQKLSFPACDCMCQETPQTIHELQKYMRQEPWNDCARYLLILNLLQKAREERFPSQTCNILQRLISAALSKRESSHNCMFNHYKKFQLLLCASEISLQCGTLTDAEDYAKDASLLPLPHKYLFFGNLLLSRIYAAKGDHLNVTQEYARCLELKTDYHIGWICLKIMECQYAVQGDSSVLESSFRECSKEWKNSCNMWTALFNLVLGLAYLSNNDPFSAEDCLSQACRLVDAQSCLLLCHGAICLELARRFCSSQFLVLAKRSLVKASNRFVIPMPIASLLIAQVEGSLGHRETWQKHLHLEWYSWPPEMRTAELFFQMHLLARESRAAASSSLGSCQSPEQWVLRAIHRNPSCSRYWRVLKKLLE